MNLTKGFVLYVGLGSFIRLLSFLFIEYFQFLIENNSNNSANCNILGTLFDNVALATHNCSANFLYKSLFHISLFSLKTFSINT